MNAVEELKKLKKSIELTVKNKEDYPKDEINVIVSNHNCLMDIFYLPMALSEELISLISARLVYKKENTRKEVVNKYLYAMPIEAHGGKKYADLCLEYATKFLEEGKSINIFPEGAYIPESGIFRGHTGASRILYKAREKGKPVNLVPISINVKRNDDLDNYQVLDDIVEVTVLPPIDYEESYYQYKCAKDKEEVKHSLHDPIDTAMQNIARNLNIPYVDEYIELRRKGNVMFADGTVIDTNVAQNESHIARYREELDNRMQKYLEK